MKSYQKEICITLVFVFPMKRDIVCYSLQLAGLFSISYSRIQKKENNQCQSNAHADAEKKEKRERLSCLYTHLFFIKRKIQ